LLLNIYVSIKEATSLLSGVGVDKQRMRTGQWPGSVLCFSCSSLTLLLGDRKDKWPIKTTSCQCTTTWPSRLYQKNNRWPNNV